MRSEHLPRIQDSTSWQGCQEGCSPAAKMTHGNLEKARQGSLSEQEMSEPPTANGLQGRRGGMVRFSCAGERLDSVVQKFRGG